MTAQARVKILAAGRVCPGGTQRRLGEARGRSQNGRHCLVRAALRTRRTRVDGGAARPTRCLGWARAPPATTSRLWLPTFWQRPRPIPMGEVHRLGTTETDVVVAVVRRVPVAVGGAHVRRVVVVPRAPAKHARAVSQVCRAPVIRRKPPIDECRRQASAGAGCVSSHRSFGRSPGCFRKSARVGRG